MSQYFDKTRFDVYLVILDVRNPFFSLDLTGVKVVDLKTIKSSRSFFSLLNLIKKEKPYAIFTTGGQVNILLSLISLFVYVPVIIARETNLLDVFVKYRGFKAKFWDRFTGLSYRRFKFGICQSAEIKLSLKDKYGINDNKLVVIPNPVISNELCKVENTGRIKNLVVVCRLSPEKGIERVINMFSKLPDDYKLTIIGDGILREDLKSLIESQQLSHRIQMTGQISNVINRLVEFDLFLLGSYTEGFPNAVIEALSVGVPVVAFKVSGISEIIKPGFNGYIIEQNEEAEFIKKVQLSLTQQWNHREIKQDIQNRFDIKAVVKSYENLVDGKIL
jgi:glycosyltransferase involved in cell wall biosynthesis